MVCVCWPNAWEQLRDIAVGAITHPSSNLADFYREMGICSVIELKPHNRWGGIQELCANAGGHLEGTLLRPVLLMRRSAGDAPHAVLNELRLLGSRSSTPRSSSPVASWPAMSRLSAKLRRDEFAALGSRLATAPGHGYADRKELLACLKHLLASAGNANLMTPG